MIVSIIAARFVAERRGRLFGQNQMSRRLAKLRIGPQDVRRLVKTVSAGQKQAATAEIRTPSLALGPNQPVG